MSTPEFLAIGHVTVDLSRRRRQLGGAALYSALAANRLGLNTALVTSAQPEQLRALERFPLTVAARPSAQTTTFRNTYRGGRRTQALLARADTLTHADVPAAWRRAGIVYLAPVAWEVGPELFDQFPTSLRAVGVQGWMRERDAAGLVRRVPLPRGGDELHAARVAFLSEEDLPPEHGLVDRYVTRVPCLAITRGERGACVYWDGHRHAAPAFAARVADPTGAGDVFAAAFLVRLAEEADPPAAAAFANCAASFVVERAGLDGVPTRDQVELRLREGRRTHDQATGHC